MCIILYKYYIRKWNSKTTSKMSCICQCHAFLINSKSTLCVYMWYTQILIEQC